MNRTVRTTGLVLGALAAGVTPAQVASAAVAPQAKTASVPAKTAVAPRAATAASCTRSMDYGRVTVRVKVAGGKASFVSVSAPKELPRSAAINATAVPKLKARALKTGMTSSKVKRIRTVSGATETSKAFRASLKCALIKVHR